MAKDNEVDQDTDTDTEVEDRQKLPRRPGERDVIIEWDDPPMEFKDYEKTWESHEFPVLMLPYNNGRQIIYNKDDQQTFFESVPPAWWLYPNTSSHLFGEEFRPDMGKVKFWLAFMYNSNSPAGDGIQIDSATWLVNDIYEPELDANQRAYKMVNLGGQPTGVMLANIYQANSEETFNKYMTAFQDAGFRGALVRPLDHMLGDPEFAVFNTI